SLSSSSTTMITFPCFISSIASSMELSFIFMCYVYVFVKVTLLFAHSYNALVKYDLVLFRLSFRNQKRELLSYFLQELFSLHFVVVHIKYCRVRCRFIGQKYSQWS